MVFLQVINTNNKGTLKIARQGQKVPTYLSSASATTRKSFITSAPPRIHASSHPLQSRRSLSRRQANIRRGWRRFSPSARRGRWTSATTTASRWRTPTRESRSWNPPRLRRWAGRSPPGPPRCWRTTQRSRRCSWPWKMLIIMSYLHFPKRKRAEVLA